MPSLDCWKMQRAALGSQLLSKYLQCNNNQERKSANANLCANADFGTQCLRPCYLKVTSDESSTSYNKLV